MEVFWLNQYLFLIATMHISSAITRIVLDGHVGEHHCYYPIELPRLRAGETMRLDVTLKRMGTPDPDIPAGGDMITLETHIVPWDIRESREEIF